MKRILLLTLLSTAFFSCSKSNLKDESSIKQEAVQSQIQFRNSENNWADAKNTNNPYDNIGLQHNLCLKSILANTTYANLTDGNKVFNAAVDFGNANYLQSDMQAFTNNFNGTYFQSFYNSIDQSTPPTAQDIIAMLNTSGDTRLHLENILNEIYNQNNSDDDYETMKIKIVNWESEIDNLNISQNEKFKLYAFGSTLRYSLLAWSTALFPENSNGNIQMRMKWFGWIATAVFDAAGAVIGSPLGPVGSIAGGAACSAGCAAVCSHNNW